MILDINHLTPQQLESAAQFFDEHGYVRLSGLEQSISGGFEDSLADAIGVTRQDLQPLLDPRADASVFSREVRQRLSRISTSPQLAHTLLSSLSSVITTLVGPIVHVSSTFHGQFKGGDVGEIEHYHNESAADYMEVHGAYRLHQDFTGASLPTSPSGLTLWVALNDCPQSTLRLYPGSHKLGMFCHTMWKRDDARLAKFPVPAIDIEAQVGTGVLFNALLFHGTGKTGPLRRVSCDLRFFPLCGFLPSEAHFLHPRPVEMLRKHQQRDLGPTLLAPVLEQLAYLHESVPETAAPDLSTLNWANYVAELMGGDAAAALPHLARFINTDLLENSASVLVQKFHNRPLQLDRLRHVRDRVDSTAANGT